MLIIFCVSFLIIDKNVSSYPFGSSFSLVIKNLSIGGILLESFSFDLFSNKSKFINLYAF